MRDSTSSTSSTGIAATALAICLMETMAALGRPFVAPEPTLFAALAYACFAGDLRQGMVSAASGWLYACWFYAASGGASPDILVSYRAQDLLRLLVLALLMPAAAFAASAVRIAADAMEISVSRFSARLAASVLARRRRAGVRRRGWKPDAVTGLPARRDFSRGLDDALALAAEEGEGVGVVALNLDDFRRVNDSHGHDVGDELLKAVGQRISDCIRRGDLAGRLGGDEFALCLVGAKKPGAVEEGARRILRALSQPFALPNVADAFTVSARVGIARFPEDGSESGVLLRKACDALALAAKGEVKDASEIEADPEAPLPQSARPAGGRAR